jgi:ubiquinone/menaquinone biosynthesis C-methylase UbiE
MATEHTRAAYDQIAAQYATVNAAMPTELAAAADRFLHLAGPGALVLDLGCGGGWDMAWLVTRGATVVGCDISQDMLQQSCTVSSSPLIQMDMRHLSVRRGQVQGIWCCASLLHLPKRDAPGALAEMGRALAIGGVLFLSIQEGADEGWGRCGYAPVERWFARYSQDEMANLLTETGACCWLQFFASHGR